MRVLRPIAALTALGAAILACTARADIIYDVTFENPPHVLGAAVVDHFGSPWLSDRPYDAPTNWVVSSGVPGFASQVAVVTGGAPGLLGYSGMTFAQGPDYTSGVHVFSWSWSLLSPDAGELVQGAVSVNGSQGPAQEIYLNFLTDGSVRIYDPVHGSSNVSTYVAGQVYLFAITFDMDAQTYGFSIDGTPIISARPTAADPDVYGLAFLRPFGSASFAVDNIRWEIIPEPSTLALMTVAGLGLALLNRRKPAD